MLGGNVTHESLMYYIYRGRCLLDMSNCNCLHMSNFCCMQNVTIHVKLLLVAVRISNYLYWPLFLQTQVEAGGGGANRCVESCDITV